VNRSSRRSSVGAFIASLGIMATALLTTVVGTAIAANPSASLDQCANDQAPSPDTDGCATNASQWVNGNVGSSKAVYLEGDSLPYRMTFGSLSLGSHTVTIEWDTTKGGKHALDYLTTFDRTVATANPCIGVSGCGAPTTFAIPVDTQVTGAGVTQIAGNFTLYGGTITAVSSYSGGATFPTGDNSRRITLTFTASKANPVLAWAAHISTRLDWGLNNSAIAISGSPYHTRLVDLDGAGGNQDRSLSSDAVVFPATITIVKHSNNPDSTSFSFTASPTPLSNFSLIDSSSSTDPSQVTTITDPANFKTYTVTEGSITGWTLASLGCTDVSQTGGSASTSGSTATIILKEGDAVTCTYTNSAVVPKLRLVKTVTNNNGGTAVAHDWTLIATGSGGFNDLGDSATHHAVTSGVQYSLSESGPSGYSAASAWSCTGGGTFASPNKITLALGDDVTCTINNDDNAPALRLRKTITNDNGGGAAATDWTLTATGTVANPTNLSGTTPVNSGTGFKADSYTLAEINGPSGYTASSWSCVLTGTNTSVSAPGGVVSVGLGQDVTCTINNDDTKASPSGTTEMSWILRDSLSITNLRTSGGASSVTFKLFDNLDACNADSGGDIYSTTVSDATGNNTSAGPVSKLVTVEGTYYWKATYSGNQNNNGFVSPCGAEVTTIQATNTHVSNAS
jgi:hypothetical protein